MVTRPVEQWTHSEELVERQLAVENMASSQAVSVFEILRRNNLVRQNQFRQFGSVLCESFDDGVGERDALAFPVGVFQFEGRVLHVDGHHMCAGGSERR